MKVSVFLKRCLLTVATLQFLTFISFGAGNPGYLRIPLLAGVPTIDPGLVEDSISIEIVEQLFLGLTDFDPKSYEVIPELALDWSQNRDGKKYTFRLRNDVRWTNGDRVTAHDIVWAMRRNIDPVTESPYANAIFPLKNAVAINEGKIPQMEKLGVKALDDFTIEFELVSPIGYFPAIAGIWTYRPLHRKTLAKHGTKWTQPKYLVSNGSYILKEWQPDKQLILSKNDAYFAADSVDIEHVRYLVIPEASTGT